MRAAAAAAACLKHFFIRVQIVHEPESRHHSVLYCELGLVVLLLLSFYFHMFIHLQYIQLVGYSDPSKHRSMSPAAVSLCFLRKFISYINNVSQLWQLASTSSRGDGERNGREGPERHLQRPRDTFRSQSALHLYTRARASVCANIFTDALARTCICIEKGGLGRVAGGGGASLYHVQLAHFIAGCMGQQRERPS